MKLSTRGGVVSTRMRFGITIVRRSSSRWIRGRYVPSATTCPSPSRPSQTYETKVRPWGRLRASSRTTSPEPSTISTLTRSALRSRKRIAAEAVSQSQTGEKVLSTVGPTIGLRVSFSFSVTTNAAQVATSSAATSATGASRALIARPARSPSRAASDPGGAPRRESSSRPPERRL